MPKIYGHKGKIGLNGRGRGAVGQSFVHQEIFQLASKVREKCRPRRNIIAIAWLPGCYSCYCVYCVYGVFAVCAVMEFEFN